MSIGGLCHISLPVSCHELRRNNAECHEGWPDHRMDHAIGQGREASRISGLPTHRFSQGTPPSQEVEIRNRDLSVAIEIRELVIEMRNTKFEPRVKGMSKGIERKKAVQPLPQERVVRSGSEYFRLCPDSLRYIAQRIQICVQGS